MAIYTSGHNKLLERLQRQETAAGVEVGVYPLLYVDFYLDGGGGGGGGGQYALRH